MKKRVWIDVPKFCLLEPLFAPQHAPSTPEEGEFEESHLTNKPISTAKKTTAKRRKPAVASWRNTQKAPTPDRYKEIQQALASKGYLESGTPSGVWDNSSVEALKKFQADQSLEPSGKLDSVSLVALGLGPKRRPTALPPVEIPHVRSASRRKSRIETRVSLGTERRRFLHEAGHRTLVETGAGAGSAHIDDEYQRAGARSSPALPTPGTGRTW